MPKRAHSVLIFLVALLGAWNRAQAQEPPKVTFGLVTGLSVSTMASGEGSMQTSWPDEGLANYTGGGFVLVPLGARISLRAEIVYSGKGSMGAIQDENGTWTFLTDRLHYLAFPVVLRIAFKRVASGTLTPYAVVGPEFAVRLKASQTADIGGTGQEVTTRSLDPFVKGTDTGVAFGGGVEYKRFIVEGRYTLGLANVSADPSLPDAKNRAFGVLLGIRFSM